MTRSPTIRLLGPKSIVFTFKLNSNMVLSKRIFISTPLIHMDIYSFTLSSKLEYKLMFKPFINKSILEENSKSFGINFSSGSLISVGVSFSLGVGVSVVFVVGGFGFELVYFSLFFFFFFFL